MTEKKKTVGDRLAAIEKRLEEIEGKLDEDCGCHDDAELQHIGETVGRIERLLDELVGDKRRLPDDDLRRKLDELLERIG